jgi:putative ABC transport system permease protein
MLAMLSDLRSSAVVFRRSPAFAAAIVVTLALGIAPNCVVFAIMDAVYFKPLPYPVQDRLVLLNVSHPGKATLDTVDAFTFTEWQRQAIGFERMAAYRNAPVSLNWSDRPERMPGQLVTGEFFQALGVQPLLGRTIEQADAAPGAPPVIVVSHRVWQEYFGARNDVVGQALRINGAAGTVVGVMPPDFVSFMEGRPARVWAPMAVAQVVTPEAASPATGGNAVARLKPGVSLEAARASLAAAHAALAARHPEFYRDRASSVRDFRSSLFAGLGPGIRMLSVLVGLLLLIACGNAANLLLGRALQRAREVAVRTALGARRWQLVRALVVESFALAAAGAALGVVLAYWAVGVVWARTAPIFEVIGVEGMAFDRRVLIFAVMLAAAVAVLFGVLPALRESRTDLVHALKEGTAGAGRGAGRRTMSRALVVGQVALCMVTMIAATLVLRSVSHFAGLAASPGFRPDALLIATLPAAATPGAPEARLASLREIETRVTGLPGVERVAQTDRVPFLEGGAIAEVERAAGGPSTGQSRMRFDAELRTASVDFFAVMSMPLLRGRSFLPSDSADSSPVAVVSDRLASARWSDRDPLGDRVLVQGTWRTVVGVVASNVQPTPFRAVPGEVFVPVTQGTPGDVKLIVRANRDVAGLAPSIRGAVRAVDADQPVADLQTMNEALGRFMTPFRLILGLTLAFSGIALSLAAVGLYSVIAHSVARRTREMGVRMALGADRRQVVRLVLGEGLRLAFVGLLVGLLPGLALAKILPAALFGVGGLSPLHLGATMLVWLAVAFSACLLPACRAARVEPMAALRCE